jgi:diguanylate cyclase (GGDEF)-like protein/PAS domain S-box-containing protein
MSDADADPGLPGDLVLRALQAAGEGISVVDGERAEHPVVWVNEAFEKISGFGFAQLIGSNLRVLQGGDRAQPALAELHEALAGERGCSVLLRNYRPDGTMYWNNLRVEPRRSADGRLWWLGFSRDVSAEHEMKLTLGRRAEELEVERRRLSEVDSVDRLTGLQSVRSFELALELSWFSCARDGRPLALFVFAPDYFDTYLETFGRVAGDSCLRMTARSVSAAFRRASDVAGRLGESAFAALATDMQRDLLEAHARRVCDRVRSLAIHNPHAPITRALTLSAAVLLARPGRAADWRGMLQEARSALTAAQAAGVEQVVVRDYGGEDG